MMKLALYKGPSKDWMHKFAHWAICVFTGSPYSHCELVLDGYCYSASSRDGGVRKKYIDLNSGKWDVLELDSGYDPAVALAWFAVHEGQPYDWPGVFGLAMGLSLHSKRKSFCSEACGSMLGFEKSHKLWPNTLGAKVKPLLGSQQ